MKYTGLRTSTWILGFVATAGAAAGTAQAARDPAGDIRAERGGDVGPILDRRPHPRVKLSVNRFAVNNLDTMAVPLTGAHLEVFPLSERWMRGGFGVQGGTGRATAVGSNISLTYGMLGLTGGIQYPARVTPFLEGHLSGGVLSGRQVGTLNVGGTAIMGNSGTTWLYGRGINVGAEFYVSGRVYVSAALGWMRASWGAPDLTAQVQNPQAALRLVDVTSDSLLWKLGVGL